ncbi:MAG: hypothetical protein NTV61_04595 [Candidatus Bathyarchaeota archaeon]|nr:hypothetical protein [Candidatus Bathyarchaeota archaeon]
MSEKDKRISILERRLEWNRVNKEPKFNQSTWGDKTPLNAQQFKENVRFYARIIKKSDDSDQGLRNLAKVDHYCKDLLIESDLRSLEDAQILSTEIPHSEEKQRDASDLNTKLREYVKQDQEDLSEGGEFDTNKSKVTWVQHPDGQSYLLRREFKRPHTVKDRDYLEVTDYVDKKVYDGDPQNIKDSLHDGVERPHRNFGTLEQRAMSELVLMARRELDRRDEAISTAKEVLASLGDEDIITISIKGKIKSKVVEDDE